MNIRLIREAHVGQLLDMKTAVEAVEQAFVEQSEGTGINEPRRRVHQPNSILHLMSGALIKRGYWGFKAYTTGAGGARFTVNLYRTTDGALVSILEADQLGQIRTGAASGVATRYLARKDSRVLALIGAGYQAETQLAAIVETMDLSEVRVFARTEQSREAFCARQEKLHGLPVRATSHPDEALQGADVITTITSSSQPVVSGKSLMPGVHINAAGSNGILRTELDREAIQRADSIFVDDVAQARIECGDLIQAHARNALVWSRVRNLADVVAGVTFGRNRDADITLFESQGIAIWDIAVAAVVYERAEASGVGELISFGN